MKLSCSRFQQKITAVTSGHYLHARNVTTGLRSKFRAQRCALIVREVGLRSISLLLLQGGVSAWHTGPQHPSPAFTCLAWEYSIHLSLAVAGYLTSRVPFTNSTGGSIVLVKQFLGESCSGERP
jgi:hypothetical protein